MCRLTFVRSLQAPNASVLVLFHNTVEGRGSEGQLAIDGSFLAAVGNLIVVTAGSRVGVFGFLSSGESLVWLLTPEPRPTLCVCPTPSSQSPICPFLVPGPPPAR